MKSRVSVHSYLRSAESRLKRLERTLDNQCIVGLSHNMIQPGFG